MTTDRCPQPPSHDLRPVPAPRAPGLDGGVPPRLVRAVLAGLLALGAGAARADTTIAMSGDTTVEMTPATHSSSGDTPVGAFGESFTTSGSVEANTSGGNENGTVQHDTYLTTFGHSWAVGSVSTFLDSSQGNFTVSITGWDAFTKSDPIDALEADQISFSKCENLAGGSAGYLGMTATAAIAFCPGISLTASYDSSSNTMGLTATPGVSANLSLSAGVGSSTYGSVGAYGTLSLVSLSLPVKQSWEVNHTPSSSYMTYSFNAQLTLTALSGSLGLYAKVLWITDRYRLVSWTGFSLFDILIITDSIPTASDPAMTLAGGTFDGSYTYNDPEDFADKSEYLWYRATDSSGDGSSEIDTQQNHAVVDADENSYLMFCVTPDNGGTKGSTVCTDWTSVGPLARLYGNSSYGGSEVAIPYEDASYDGECFNLTDESFNDQLSSFKFDAPTGVDALLVLFKDSDCSGTSYQESASAGQTNDQSYVGSAMNDTISSVRVVTVDSVSASDVSIQAGPGYLQGIYTFEDDNGLEENGTTFKWQYYYTSVAYGSAWEDCDGSSSGQTFTVPDSCNGSAVNEVRFCVTPSDGFATGSETCSSGVDVSSRITLYDSTSYAGNSIAIYPQANPGGLCINLSDNNFNDLVSSYDCTGYLDGEGNCNTVTDFQFALYSDADCTGSFVSSSSRGRPSNLANADFDNIASSVYVAVGTAAPTTSDVTLYNNVTELGGDYTYADSDGISEGTPSYWFERADDASGTNATQILDSLDNKPYSLTQADDSKYERFCVTPMTKAGKFGSENCTGWSAIGPTVTFYKDSSYSGSSETYSYEQYSDGTCVNLPSSMNDVTSSLLWSADGGYATSLTLYKNSGCGGSSVERGPLAAGGSDSIASLSGTLGSSWQDSVSSFRLVWNDVPTATGAKLAFGGDYVTGSYSYSDNLGYAESGSTYVVERASDGNGTNATTVATSKTYFLAPADQNKYLRFCVYPSDDYTVGATDCSAWSSVGNLLMLFQDSSYGGTNLNFAYQQSADGACVNLSSYGFDNALSSFQYFGPFTTSSTLTFYDGANCVGTTLGFQTMQGGLEQFPSLGGFNDLASSFKVSW